jgi:hypothetical protein
VLVLDGESDKNGTQVYLRLLPPTSRGGADEAVASIYSTLIPLGVLRVPRSATTVEARIDSPGSGSSVVVAFSKLVDEADAVPPEVMYLTHSIGFQATLGFQATRRCFEVAEFPICRANNGTTMDSSNVVYAVDFQQDAAAESTEPSLETRFLHAMTTFWTELGVF